MVGSWADYVGGGTPRDFGPCGAVLDRDRALLFAHPERDFPYLAAVGPGIEEALLIPFTSMARPSAPSGSSLTTSVAASTPKICG